MKRLWIPGLLALAGLAYAAPGWAQDKAFSLGTGGQAGAYYRTGEAICGFVNRGRKDHGLRCAAAATPGSVSNLNQIRRGDLDVAIAQSDLQAYAYEGTDVFKAAGPDTTLRSLVALYPESLTVVAHRDAGIATVDDLIGKKLNIGQPGSGSRRTIEAVIAARGRTPSDFALMTDLKPDEVLGGFCNKEFDAFVLVIAHPNALVREALERCNGVLVPMRGDAIDGLVADHREYVATTISRADYGLKEPPIASFGVIATVVTSERLDDETAFRLVEAVAANLERLKKSLPVMRDMSPEALRRANTAPLHPGAARYFEEAGRR